MTTAVQNDWVHPTGNRPKTIHLVCLGPSHRDYDQLWLSPDTPPVLLEADEVWTVNRGSLNIRHDLAFVLDHIQGEAEKHPNYGACLWHHDKPIITSDNLEGWPPHVHAYPFGQIWSWMQQWPKRELTNAWGDVDNAGGPPVHADWCINSVPMVLWYACWLGVRKIITWGADYHHHDSGRVESGHPNVAYWAGVFERECGMQVTAPNTSTLLDSNARGHFYGYQRDPRPHAVAKRAEFRRMVGLDKPAEDGNG